MKTGQVIQFPLSRGLDEDANPKAKSLATLKAGNNIRWPKDGVIGKRWGSRVLGGLANISRFLTRGSELAGVNTSGVVKVYDAINDNVSAVSPDVPKAELDWSTTLLDDETGVASTDAVRYGNMIVHAWVSGDPTKTQEATPVLNSAGNLYVQVVNRTTKQVLIAPTRVAVSSVRQVRVLLSGTVAFVIFSAGATIRYVAVNLSTLAVGAAVTLKSDAVITSDNSFYSRFDAIIKANGDLVLVYEKNTTASSALSAVLCTISSTTITVSTSVDHTDTTWTNATSIAIAEDTGGGQIVLVYSRSSTVRVRSFNRTTMASIAAATSVQTSFVCTQVAVYVTATNTATLAWSGYATGSVRLPEFITESWTVSSGSVVAVTRSQRRSMSFALLSRFFTLGGVLHVFAVDGRDGEDDGNINSRTTYPSTYMLQVVSFDYGSSLAGPPPHVLAGKIDHDIGGIFQGGSLPQVPSVDSSTVYGLLPFQATAAQESFNWRIGLRLVRTTVDTSLMADPWRSVVIGQEAYVKGAYLAAWDGRNVFDYGMRAPVLVLLQEAVNGGSMANGTYLYQFVPGYRSRAGVLHRGPLSDTITAIISGGPSASVSLRLCSHGPDGKQTANTGYANAAGTSAYLDAFRTEANGSVLYQLTMAPRYNVFVNDPTATTIDLTDTRSDSDIGGYGSESPAPAAIALSSRPQPYTSTGELEDCQPPAQFLIHLHGGRIFLVIGDRRTIWYSKDYRENPGVAPGFNSTMIELYDQPITALASLDEKRIIFWDKGLWYVVGDGPNVSGTDNRFSEPIIIQSDVGCDNPRSVVATPMGVIFQYRSDLYILNRNLTVDWLGKSARDTLASYPNITSAVLVPAEGEVRFTCNNAAGTAGIVLVFDYTRNTWFTRTYPTGGPIADAVLHEGVYYLATNGEVRYEDTTVNYDVISSVNTYVASTVELDHVGLGGPVSWQRVRVAKMLGQALSNHALTMSIARDFSTTYEQSEAFAAGSSVTTPSGHMRAEVALTVQRRQSVGVKFVDAAPSNTTLYPIGNGAGFQLEGIALLVQPKSGLPRDTSSRRGG